MLKLIVNNERQEQFEEKLSCRNSCELYDTITESCSIKGKVDDDSTYEVLRCGSFISRILPDTVEREIPLYEGTDSPRFRMISEVEEYIVDDEVLFQLLGQKKILENSTYPQEPDFPANRDDAIWYVSPKGEFGCWIINKSSRKLMALPKGKVEQGWSENVYKSPVPLHDHRNSLGIASRVAWVIDEDGYGQYALLVNGELSSFTSPKPRNWTK